MDKAPVVIDKLKDAVQRLDGSVSVLAHIAQVEMQAGELFEIQTPGGGGFGTA